MGRKPLEKQRSQDPVKRRQLASLLISSLNGDSLKDLTMDDIALRLGKSKATIYKYFRSQEELLDLALTEKLENIGGFVPILNDQSRSFVQRYRDGLAHLSIHLEDITSSFLADLKSDFIHLWNKIQEFQKMAGMVLRNFYQEGLDKGIIENIHPGIMVLSDQVLFNAMLEPTFLEENQLTTKEAFEYYFQMKFFGLLKAEHRN